jgi:hypothetical protein
MKRDKPPHYRACRSIRSLSKICPPFGEHWETGCAVLPLFCLVCGIATHPVRRSCPDSADPPRCDGLTLFLGPGREGSTPRYGSDVASGFRLHMKLTHRRTRAFDPHARRRPHPGQHRLPPRSSGHDPRSRRGKHADYRRGLDLWDEFVQRKMRKSRKGLKRLERKFENFPQAEKLSPLATVPAGAGRPFRPPPHPALSPLGRGETRYSVTAQSVALPLSPRGEGRVRGGAG